MMLNSFPEFKRGFYLLRDEKVTWMDLALRWIFRIASTMAADISCSADIRDDDDVVDDVIEAEAGDAVDIFDERPHDEAADDDVMMGLLWR